jgi:hypothetical protein
MSQAFSSETKISGVCGRCCKQRAQHFESLRPARCPVSSINFEADYRYVDDRYVDDRYVD